MFTNRITLFRLFGFAIKIDATWLFLAALITWSLAANVFPEDAPGLTPASYWVMGAVGASGLFASIIFHELGHALVARRHGIEIKDITLFIFGGVADMAGEPPDASSEFKMAIAGPIASVVLALGLYGAYALLTPAEGISPSLEVVAYVAWMNGMLALFNILPAFPLDGGRMLRAALWSLKGDLRWATKIAAGSGGVFGFLLITLGVFAIISNSFFVGIWWVMIGWFIRLASKASYTNIVVKRVLEEEPVRRFMQADPVTVSPQTSVHSLVEDYIYTHHYKMMPVTENGHLVGCVTTRDVKAIPRGEWDMRTVGDIMGQCSPDNSIGPNTDAMTALTLMNKGGLSRLLVIESGELKGIVALKDLMRFLSMKIELEGEEE